MPEDHERTIIDNTRAAMRGKGYAAKDRREPDKLKLKDWAGWAIAVLVPVGLGLLGTYTAVERMDVRVQYIERDLEKAQEKYGNQWEKFSDHDHD